MNMVSLITFLIATVGVALGTTWFVRKMAKAEDPTVEYFTGGRALTWPIVAGSLLLTNLSTEQLVGLNGAVFLDGNLAGIAWEVGAAIAMVLTALFFLPRYLRNGFATTPGYLALRFDKATRQVVSSLFLFGYAVTFLPVVLYTGAKAIGGMFGLEIDLWLIVLAIGALGSAYAVIGGLKSVAVSDTINGIGLLVGGLLIPFLALQSVGDGSVLGGLDVIFAADPARFQPLGSPENSVPWPTLLTGMLIVNVFYWSTNQVIVQRALGAESLEAGQKGILFAAGLKLIGPVMLCLPGLIALHLVSEGTLMVDSTCGPDKTAICSADIYPSLVREVLPAWSLGLFAAVLVGAVLSSFNSGLNSASTLFSLQFYREYMKPNATPQELVKAGRVFGLGLTLFTIALAPLLDHWSSIFHYLQVTNGLYSVPIITVFTVGMLSKRVPPLGAKVGMAVGGGIYAYFVLAPEFQSAPDPDGLHWLHNLAIAYVIGCIAMLIIGYIRPLTQVQHDARFGQVNSPVSVVPWAHARQVSAVIIALVALIYGALTLLASGS